MDDSKQPVIQATGPSLGSSPSVYSVFETRSSIYYSVTGAEIDQYASLGWGANVLFILSGTALGYYLSNITTLNQGNLSATGQIWAHAALLFSGIATLLFAALTFACILLQCKSRKPWKSNEIRRPKCP